MNSRLSPLLFLILFELGLFISNSAMGRRRSDDSSVVSFKTDVTDNLSQGGPSDVSFLLGSHKNFATTVGSEWEQDVNDVGRSKGDKDNCCEELYSNPCCCFGITVFTGSSIIAYVGCFLSVVSFAIGATAIFLDMKTSESGALMGLIYLLDGGFQFALHLGLILALKRSNPMWMMIYGLGRFCAVMITIGGLLLAYVLVKTPNRENWESYFVIIPIFLAPVDFYCISVVSNYASILKNVEMRFEAFVGKKANAIRIKGTRVNVNALLTKPPRKNLRHSQVQISTKPMQAIIVPKSGKSKARKEESKRVEDETESKPKRFYAQVNTESTEAIIVPKSGKSKARKEESKRVEDETESRPKRFYAQVSTESTEEIIVPKSGKSKARKEESKRVEDETESRPKRLYAQITTESTEAISVPKSLKSQGESKREKLKVKDETESIYPILTSTIATIPEPKVKQKEAPKMKEDALAIAEAWKKKSWFL